MGRRVTKFSFIGYSLGGLIGRYLIGYDLSLSIRTRLTCLTLTRILYQKGLFTTSPSPSSSPSPFTTPAQPINFITIASPHIGLINYRNFFSTLSHSLGPTLLSRTGEQFFSADKWGKNGESLLEVMADPERVFWRALSGFERLEIYANA